MSEQQDPNKVGFTPTEVHNQSTEDILAQQQASIASETGNPPEEKPQPTETPKEETPIKQPEQAEPALNVDELKTKLGAELKDEISKEVAEKVVHAIAPNKEETVQPPWVKENRNPTYQEAIDWAATTGLEKATPQLVDKVTEKVMENLNAEVKQEEKQAQDAKLQEEETAKQWHTYWDAQFKDLEEQGKILKVERDEKGNPKNTERDENGVPKDPAQKQRYDIFAAMTRINQENAKIGKPPVTSVKEIFYENYPNKQPAGANAPVYGAHKSTGGANTGNFTYQDVKESSVDGLLSELHGQRGTI